MTAGGTSVWQRVGREVETVGVLPVPDSERRTTSGKLLVVWAMTSASATTPLIGALLYSAGLWYMIGAIVLTWLIFMIPCGLFSEMGRELPLTGLIVARRNYGWSATFGFSVLFTFVNMAWFGLNTATGALILAALSHTSAGMWYWIVGGVDIILVLFGFKWLEYFYRYTAVLLVGCYIALTVYLFTHFTLHVPARSGPVDWGTAISTVAGFSILAWTYKTSTLSRFAKPADQTPGRRTWYLLVPGIGIMIPVLLMGAMGMFSQEAIGNWNIAVLGAHISGWGLIAAIGAALGVLHTNAMNLYPSTVDLLVALNSVRKPRRWEQPAATIVLGVLGTLLAQLGILSHAETFITDVGDILGPFAFVMLVDWLWGRMRDKRDPGTYFRTPLGFSQHWKIGAIVSFFVGFVFSFWGTSIFPAGFYGNFPLALFGSLVSAVLYAIYVLLPSSGQRPGVRSGYRRGGRQRSQVRSGSRDLPSA
jgi:purine-cytosine permease-like protein